jgi:hypothetical protein
LARRPRFGEHGRHIGIRCEKPGVGGLYPTINPNQFLGGGLVERARQRGVDLQRDRGQFLLRRFRPGLDPPRYVGQHFRGHDRALP